MLQVILGYSQMLLTGKKPDQPDYKDLIKIVKASEQEAELVRRLLIFAKQTPTAKAVTELNTEIRNIVGLLSRTCPKDVDIDADLEEDPNPTMADAA